MSVRIEPSILLPVVGLVLYIAFLGWWLHMRPSAPVTVTPNVLYEIPVQTYSPQYRDSTKCFDCVFPYPYLQPSHGQAKMTPGF